MLQEKTYTIDYMRANTNKTTLPPRERNPA